MAGLESFDQASKLADPNALEAVGFNGEANQQPVCAEIYRFIGTMKTGKEIQIIFMMRHTVGVKML
ncbi:hypothetical protein ACEZDF_17880 [Vibrio alginolyticus]|uniref:hypothetical protein n=1 Tax=Vibrio alginolyticus TaxID=663 RepID=UPI0035C09227